MRLILLISTFVSLGIVAQASIFSGRSEKLLRRLDLQLKYFGGSKANIESLSQFADQLKSKKSDTNQRLLELVQKILSIRTINDGNRCSKESAQILSTIDEALRPLSIHSLPYKEDHKFAVQSFLANYFSQHARDCVQVHIENHRQLRDHLDIISQPIRQFMLVTIEARAKSKWPDEYKYFTELGLLELPKDKQLKAERSLAYGALDTATRKKPENAYLETMAKKGGGKKVVNKEKVAQIVENYVTKPCEKFVTKMEPLFAAARFDLEQFELDSDSSIKYMGPGYTDMYNSYTRFRMCKMYLAGDDRRLTQSVIDYIEWLCAFD